MTDRNHDDDRAAEAVLAALEGERLDDTPAGDTEADETLRRLYLETLGLLAYDAEPAAPRPEVKERLMAALGDRDGEAPPTPPAAVPEGVLPFEHPERAPPAEDRGAPAAGGGGPASAPEPAHARPGGRSRIWLAALAALFALAAVGLAGFLWNQLETSRAAIAQLERERSRLVEELESRTAAAAETGNLEEVLAVASRPGIEVCPMRPVGADPVVPEASAMVFMPPEGPKWFLVAHGLEPAGEGVYRVWINTPRGAMPAGVLEPGQRSTLQMPAGLIDPEDMLSVTVTLESEPEARNPDGPMVLFGDQMMQIL